MMGMDTEEAPGEVNMVEAAEVGEGNMAEEEDMDTTAAPQVPPQSRQSLASRQSPASHRSPARAANHQSRRPQAVRIVETMDMVGTNMATATREEQRVTASCVPRHKHHHRLGSM